MVPLIIILAVFLLIFLILMQWIKLHISADEKVTVKVGVGPVMLNAESFSGKKKKKKKKRVKTKKKKASPDSEKKEQPEKKRSALGAIGEVIGIVKDILPKAFKKFHLRARVLEVKVATGDAASTAIACGAAKAGAALLLELIDTYAVIDKKKKDSVIIEPDFLSDKTTYKIDLRFRMRVLDSIGILAKAVILFVKMKAKSENN